MSELTEVPALAGDKLPLSPCHPPTHPKFMFESDGWKPLVVEVAFLFFK